MAVSEFRYNLTYNANAVVLNNLVDHVCFPLLYQPLVSYFFYLYNYISFFHFYVKMCSTFFDLYNFCLKFLLIYRRILGFHFEIITIIYYKIDIFFIHLHTIFYYIYFFAPKFLPQSLNFAVNFIFCNNDIFSTTKKYRHLQTSFTNVGTILITKVL